MRAGYSLVDIVPSWSGRYAQDRTARRFVKKVVLLVHLSHPGISKHNKRNNDQHRELSSADNL